MRRESCKFCGGGITSFGEGRYSILHLVCEKEDWFRRYLMGGER